MRALIDLGFVVGVGIAGCGGDSSGRVGDAGGDMNDASVQDSTGGDSSGDGPTDGSDGGTFNVAGLPGLVLWLNGEKDVQTVGAKVTSWHDQSGNSNDAAETRDAAQPSLVQNVMHGRPAVHFTADPQAPNGKDLIIAPSSSLGWGPADFLVEVVAQYDNTLQQPDSGAEQAVGYGAFYTTITATPIDTATGVGLYANVPPIGNSAATTGFLAFAHGIAAPSSGNGYNNTTPHTFGMQRTAGNLTARLDGAVVGTQAIPVNADVGSSVGAQLGAIENAATQRLDGDIAEVIAVRGTIATSDLTGLEGYLRSKYTLP
jgi:hypothetical protein